MYSYASILWDGGQRSVCFCCFVVFSLVIRFLENSELKAETMLRSLGKGGGGGERSVCFW